MKKILTLINVLLVFTALAQEPVVDRNVEKERIEAELNETEVKTLFQFGTNISLEEADSLKAKWNSGSIGYGLTVSFINSKRYSLVADFYYGFDNYKIIQSEKNALGLGEIYDSQQIRTDRIRVGIKNRIHLSKRGTENGVFLDLGASASFTFGTRMKIKDELDPAIPSNLGAEETEIVLKRLNFVENLGYSLNVGIGRNRVALFGQYRLSNLFRKSDSVNNGNALPEISQLLVGLRLEI